MTIKERAKVLCETLYGDGSWIESKYLNGYVLEALTDQNLVSRDEERERCIKAAQDAHCEMCGWYSVCDKGKGSAMINCNGRDYIRESIEKGGE